MISPIVGLLMLVAVATSPPQIAPSAENTAAERDRVLAAAVADVQAGRRADAKQRLATAAERISSVRLLMQLARLQSGDGDAAAALATLDRARALAPNAEEVLTAIGQLSLAAHAPVPAILVLEPLTRMSPTVAQHHYLLGVAWMQAGDLTEAVEALQEAERLEPGRALTLIALGIALNNRKRFDDAQPVLERALELEPDNVEAIAALAEAEEGLNDLDTAERHAARALARAPEHPTANLVAGLIRMKRGLYAEARDALQRTVSADPDSPKAYYQLSLAQARLGDAAASARSLELYRQKLRAMETRLEEVRKLDGRSRGGMQR